MRTGAPSLLPMFRSCMQVEPMALGPCSAWRDLTALAHAGNAFVAKIPRGPRIDVIGDVGVLVGP